MPNTSKYGFPYEHPDDDQPGITLHGGPSGTEDILAEEVEVEVERIENELGDVEERVTVLEDHQIGWTYVAHGTEEDESEFTIDLTDGGRFAVGAFHMLRLQMRFRLDAEGYVNLQINHDGGGSIYRNGSIVSRASDGDVVLTDHGVRGSWRIGYGATVSNNNLVCNLFHMQGNFLHGFQSTSTRMSSTASAHRFGTHWGSLEGALPSGPPETLRILPAVGPSEFQNAWWWLEGFIIPS